MKYINELDSENKVFNAILVNEEDVDTAEKLNSFIQLLGLSENSILSDANYIDGSFNQALNKLVHRQPFPSHTLDQNGDWVSPVPHPQVEGVSYVWNEQGLEWIVVPEVFTP